MVTPFYRPPEVCLEIQQYDEKVDIWSTGCVFAELFTRIPLFPGKSELDQLCTIFKTLLPCADALPSEEDWPGFTEKLDAKYPNGVFPPQTDASITPGAGSLRNYFSGLD